MKGEMMTRTEHVDWCKARALAYVDRGDVNNAFASLVSDLRKHTETKNHAAAELGVILIMGGCLSTERQMREFIEGVH